VTSFLNIAMILVSAGLITLILLQSKGSSLGGIFGGSDSGVYQTKRGVEKTLFNVTVGASAFFFVLAFVIVVLT
jgi:preprotein translocase subunit SecG